MSAKHAVLGLVIEQPGHAWRIAAEMRRRLSFADLVDSYPYWALDKLETEGLVGGDGALAGGGRTQRHVVYETTMKGVQAFEDWLRSPPGQGSLRDDVQFRLAVVRPHDVSHLVELIRERELVCIAREQVLERGRSADTKDAWHGAVGALTRDAELMFWQGRARWLRYVRETLEGMPTLSTPKL